MLMRTTVANLQAHDVHSGEVQTVFGYRAEPAPLGNSCAMHIAAPREARHPLGCAPAGHLMLVSGDRSPTGEVIPRASVRSHAVCIASATFGIRSTA